jgi:signal transduction histidine kinase
MNNDVKTEIHLPAELLQLRQHVADLETAEAKYKQAEQALRESQEKLKQRNAELTALNAIAITVGQSLELGCMVKAALDKVLEVTGAAAGRIQLYPNGNGRDDRALVVESGFDPPESSKRTDWSRVEIPIKAQDHTLGRLELFNWPPRQWVNQNQHFLTAIGYAVGVGIANARLFAALEQQSSQVRALGMRLVEAEEAERRRLARELHDQVGQSLTAMGINLDIIRKLLAPDTPEEIMARLDDTRTLVTRTTKRVRQVMVDLRPEMLDDYGILAALRWSAERFTQRTGVAVSVEGEEADCRLPPHVENVLYRVAQEALTNVIKHAQATQVAVSLKMNSQAVRLEVADNGGGFTPGTQVSSDRGQQWGLALMAERVEGVGGCFRLKSRPRQGCLIIVEVPR